MLLHIHILFTNSIYIQSLNEDCVVNLSYLYLLSPNSRWRCTELEDESDDLNPGISWVGCILQPVCVTKLRHNLKNLLEEIYHPRPLERQGRCEETDKYFITTARINKNSQKFGVKID